MTSMMIIGTCFDIYLYQSGTIDRFLLYSNILTIPLGYLELSELGKVSSEKVKKPIWLLQTIFAREILSHFISVYSLFTIQLFRENEILKWGLTGVFLLNFWFIIKTFRNQKRFLTIHENITDGYKIVRKSSGTRLSGLPLNLLVGNHLLTLITAFSWVTNFRKSGFNYGLYDTRNRISSITFNNDSLWQSGILIWITATLISQGFRTESFYYCILSVGIYNLLRSPNMVSIAKYYSVVIGEVVVMRPAVYDNLLVRVIPDKKKDFRSFIFLKKSDYSFSVFFLNHQFIYDWSMGFLKSYDLISGGKHLIIRFSSKDIPLNFISEYGLCVGLSSPIMIIDLWQTNHVLENLFPDGAGDYVWLSRRLHVIQHMSDESFAELNESMDSHLESRPLSDAQKREIEASQFRTAMIKSSSFEALRINIDVLENYYGEADLSRLEAITGKGVYEVNTLFRQLHESPSIPSRFIDLLNVAECMIRYLVGICHSGKSDHSAKLSSQKFDTRAISFGNCVDYLSRFLKDESDSVSLLKSKIFNFLNHEYVDGANLKDLLVYLRAINSKQKYASRPSILEISWWLVNVRNKTRGHGTPSKVNFGFYVALEKLVLYLVAEFSKMDLMFCYRSTVQDISWTFDLSHGGYPAIVPVVGQLEKSIHFNPMFSDETISRITANHRSILAHTPEVDDSPYLRVTENGTEEWWSCSDQFMVKDGVLYLLNQRDDRTENWISFSTGKILRPEIISG